MFVSPGPCPFTPLIEAQEGDNVTLQCCFDASANLQKRTVDWRRADLKTVVHVYRHGRDDPDPQMLQYRDRTTLNREDLTRGIITLQISSVQLSDSGEYMCNVPKLTAKFITLKGKHAGFIIAQHFLDLKMFMPKLCKTKET